ncbi:MAG TPA: hypothetical protein VFU47_14335, partial [Armatimonadota bacterium]|nr:hypothetical protein [Armatimonadota bacterium]
VARQLPGRDAFPDAGKRVVDVELRERPLRAAVQELLSGSGLHWAVDSRVPNVPVTLSLKQVPLVTAFRLAVRQAAAQVPGLSYLADRDVVALFIGPAANAPTALALPANGGGIDRRVTLDYRNIPLRDALALLFRDSGMDYTIAAEVQDVPISLNIKEVSFPAALRLIIRQAQAQIPGLTLNRRGNLYTVRLRRPAEPGDDMER